MRHRSVLLQEVLTGLEPKKGGVHLDMTLGDGGHAEAISERVGRRGHVIGLDRDTSAVMRAEAFLAHPSSRITFRAVAWSELGAVLNDAGENAIDTALFDLGMSFFELEESGKGFSFQREEPLQMTYGNPAEAVFTASDIVNSWDEEHLKDILLGYGEEKNASRLAKAIVSRRARGPIKTTRDLVEAIESVLHRGGRLAVISFESITDRIIKRFMKACESSGEGKRINKKVIRARREEGISNPRARSAKL